MDDIVSIQELFSIEQAEDQLIDQIPEKVIQQIMKKQETIHQISPTINRLSEVQHERYSTHSLRLSKKNSRISDNTSFHSLQSERLSGYSSPQKSQQMKQMYYDSVSQWQQSNERHKTLNCLNDIFRGFIEKLTEVKVNLMQLQQVQFETSLLSNNKSQQNSQQKHFENQDQDQLPSQKSEMNQKVQSSIITQQFSNFVNHYKTSFQKYIKTLKIRQIQVGSVLFLFEHNSKQQYNVQQYNQVYGSLQKLIIPCQSNQKRSQIKININVLEQALQTQLQLYEQYKDVIKQMNYCIVHKNYIKDQKGITKLINKFQILNSKIVTIAQLFPYVCTLDLQDLFSLPKSHPRWQKLLKNIIKYKFYGDSQKMRESFQTHKSGLNLLNATMSIIHQSKQQWFNNKKSLSKLAQSTAKIVKCAINKIDAHHQAQVLYSDPNEALTKQIWNLPDQKLVRNLIASILPSIQFSKQLWIPKLFDEYFGLKGQIGIPDVTILNLNKYMKQAQIQDPKNRLRVRINCPFPLINKNQEYLQQNKGILSGIKNYFKKSPKAPEKLIYHIHGGGFISMSSFIHQTYTRLWANNLDVPIISIDYRKAPENPYPDGLKDCFQGYMWALYCFRQVYEIQPVKVIVVGDSAGGNLCAALINLLIMYKLRIPDGLVMVYPVLNLNLRQFTPSLVNALNDFILPHTLLKLCQKAYLSKTSDKPTDHLISPLFTPEQILNKYPPVHLFVGSKDPFHDDCCRFTQKLNQLEKFVRTTVFDQFPHGFLQFDVKAQPHQPCRKAIKEVESALKQLLK